MIFTYYRNFRKMPPRINKMKTPRIVVTEKGDVFELKVVIKEDVKENLMRKT